MMGGKAQGAHGAGDFGVEDVVGETRRRMWED